MTQEFDVQKYVGDLQTTVAKWDARAPLHEIDRECKGCMRHLHAMIDPAFKAGLRDELVGVRDALVRLHEAATAKFHAIG